MCSCPPELKLSHRDQLLLEKGLYIFAASFTAILTKGWRQRFHYISEHLIYMYNVNKS
jgi:hypothetical protein